MKKLPILFLVFSLPLGAALVNLTLFNSVNLVDSDGTTKLLDGDLVQLILDGGNLVQDPADETGGLSGDDTLLVHANNPTVLGTGQVDADSGFLLVQMSYDDSLAGTHAYVRFFNDPTPAAGDFYGQSAWFTLPTADEFGNALHDFMPTIERYMADIAVIPEAGSLFLATLALGCVRMGRKTNLRKKEKR